METPRIYNLFANIPDKLAEERVENLLTGATCRLERIVSTGQSSPPGFWYDQPQAEWVVLLRGKARLAFAEPAADVTLEPGDCLLIPAHCRHRVAWTSPDEPCVWIGLHGDLEPLQDWPW